MTIKLHVACTFAVVCIVLTIQFLMTDSITDIIYAYIAFGVSVLVGHHSNDAELKTEIAEKPEQPEAAYPEHIRKAS